MARTWHPDKNDGIEAAGMFRRIKLAYDVLRDSDLRREYDNELQRGHV